MVYRRKRFKYQNYNIYLRNLTTTNTKYQNSVLTFLAENPPLEDLMVMAFEAHMTSGKALGGNCGGMDLAVDSLLDLALATLPLRALGGGSVSTAELESEKGTTPARRAMSSSPSCQCIASTARQGICISSATFDHMSGLSLLAFVSLSANPTSYHGQQRGVVKRLLAMVSMINASSSADHFDDFLAGDSDGCAGWLRLFAVEEVEGPVVLVPLEVAWDVEVDAGTEEDRDAPGVGDSPASSFGIRSSEISRLAVLGSPTRLCHVKDDLVSSDDLFGGIYGLPLRRLEF
ncbi:MAG: hypothetical protein M1836_002906 [Candelina mexicana]|nr:MAG: hypothetical protein M1836_002906 [Candelina mexicana]